jgi:zinc protease
VANEILFGGRASRLHRALIQDLELAVDCRGWVSTFRDPGLYDIGATARPDVRAEQLLEVIDRELAKLVLEPITDAELSKVKARLELGSLQGMETCAGKAEQIGFWEIVLSDPSGAFARLAALSRVTVTDVRRAARRYLRAEGRTVILVRAGVTDDDDEAEDEGDEVAA